MSYWNEFDRKYPNEGNDVLTTGLDFVLRERTFNMRKTCNAAMPGQLTLNRPANFCNTHV